LPFHLWKIEISSGAPTLTALFHGHSDSWQPGDEYRTPSLSRACVAHGWNAESRNEMAWFASTINRLARWVTSSGTGLELVRHKPGPWRRL